MNEMRVLFTIPSLDVKSGGPPLSTLLTVKGLRGNDVMFDLLTFGSLENINEFVFDENIHILPFVRNVFSYSSLFKQYLLKYDHYDLYHAQGVWLYPTYAVSRFARNQNKSYIITPRGMLYPQDLARGKWKKNIFLKFFLQKDLQRAACIHVTCKDEMTHIRNLGVKSPIAVIPNPIDISSISRNSFVKDKLRIGYLGRVHPRKNIERLIYAWHKLGSVVNETELIIIGDGDNKYMNFLKKEVQRLSLGNVIFTGFLSGEEKENALSLLSYLVVPSDFENFGMIIPEALVRGIPVIASKGTPWEELNTHKCGWWIDNDVETITSAMRIALNTPKAERQEMGKRGRQLITDKYTVEIVATQMKQLYCWILEGGEKPEFVYL